MSRFYIEIITPARVFYKGEANMLSLPTTEGRAAIMAMHEPYVFALEPGAIKIFEGDSVREAYISEGFAEIRADQTIVLTQAAEWPEEIDYNKALEAKERAEALLRHTKSYKEYKLSKASLARAFERLKFKSNHTIK